MRGLSGQGQHAKPAESHFRFAVVHLITVNTARKNAVLLSCENEFKFHVAGVARSLKRNPVKSACSLTALKLAVMLRLNTSARNAARHGSFSLTQKAASDSALSLACINGMVAGRDWQVRGPRFIVKTVKSHLPLIRAVQAKLGIARLSVRVQPRRLIHNGHIAHASIVKGPISTIVRKEAIIVLKDVLGWHIERTSERFVNLAVRVIALEAARIRQSIAQFNAKPLTRTGLLIRVAFVERWDFASRIC